jgi:transposase
MVTAAYHMLKNGLPYRDLGADHFSRHDRSKAILRLVRRLNDLGCAVQVTPQAA